MAVNPNLAHEINASNKVNIYIGYDPKETIAFHTMVQSIIEHASIPVSVTPINLRNLETVFQRERDPKQSNEFSFSRFLVPFLNDYKGVGIFFDCDMMLRTDIKELLDAINPEHAISVVQHSYTPRDDVKYLGTVQYAYPRKNWSSVIVWNCAHPSNRKVTPDFVETASGLELHRFTWLKDEEIGELPVQWNWLVGEYTEPPEDVKNVHWTLGGPYFNEYAQADYSDEWRELEKRINYCAQKVSS